jgi:hypothetical protein
LENGWDPVGECKIGDFSPIAERKSLLQSDKRVAFVSYNLGKSAIEIAGSANRDRIDGHPQRLAGRVQLLHFDHFAGICRVVQDAEPLGSRHRRPKKLDQLTTGRRHEIRYAGQIPSRARKASHKAASDRIADTEENDWNVAGQFLNRFGAWRRCYNDEVKLGLRQLSSDRGIAVSQTFRPPHIDSDILAVGPPKIVQPRKETLDESFSTGA